ncbi:hypothetical protein OG204_27855 [Streptomyces sp. NBC_01387]|uniref:hypothetical protein n=1 Tax=unclassified Streptomyces TaxID=2593676 RepID=UPI002024E6EB|nr:MULTISPECIES: hypothetical protein [unclassified Streptomyces]MCX4547841.1 hypothetical protein [Streptomyces sp. NBC_01500]WSC19523.1 hypothetical protein OIE60_07380 [Streptomyces sp. NBC_01766]WSV53544.1 hypothetical protein OG282_07350 [Streptomyces sp. NBC_01014]
MYQTETRQWCRAAAAALITVLCAGAVACGGQDRKDAKSAAAKPAGVPGPLSRARLTAASFTPGEDVGSFTASEYGLGAPFGDEYTARPADCLPLVSLKDAGSRYGAPHAEVNRELRRPGRLLGEDIAVQLRSYAHGDAARVMKALAVAGTRCRGGFTEDRSVVEAGYLRTETIRSPRIGDEAKAFRLTVREPEGKAERYAYLTVVRSGSTTLSFRSGGGSADDDGGVPAAVVDEQWQKFLAATGPDTPSARPNRGALS